MFKKTMLFAVAALVALSLAIGLQTAQADDSKGPADITLSTADAKKPAAFPHLKHQDAFECATCHHTKGDDGKQGPYAAGKEQKCETCHNKEMANAKLNSFKLAGHGLCKECHKKNKDSAPTKCAGCHNK